MIVTEIILETFRKSSKGYAVKIRVYQLGTRRYHYIPLNVYQDNKQLEMTPFLKKRDIRLIDEVEYCNKHRISLEEALLIIEKGLPDTVEDEIYFLKQRLERLQKLEPNIGIGLIEFFNVRIQEKEDLKQQTHNYILIKRQVLNYLDMLGVDDVSLNRLDREWLRQYEGYLVSVYTVVIISDLFF